MKLQGQTYIINGNEPILLNDPSRVWVVQSGSMALFAVTVKDGVIDGTRRYLCSISQGEALFGTVYQQRQILAVPIGEVELLLLHPECFRGLGAKANAWIENWLMELSSVLCQIPTPKIQVKTEGQERFSLNNGQNFQPAAGLTCWVQLQEGNVCFLGFEELILATDVAFPMNDKMWLTPVGGVQLTTHTTSEYENSDILLAGLSQLHTQILSCVTLLDEQEAQAELTRLQERQRLNRRVTAEALGELSSTLNSQDGDFFLEGTPLLVAAGAGYEQI